MKGPGDDRSWRLRVLMGVGLIHQNSKVPVQWHSVISLYIRAVVLNTFTDSVKKKGIFYSVTATRR